jgi:hypothetical protein
MLLKYKPPKGRWLKALGLIVVLCGAGAWGVSAVHHNNNPAAPVFEGKVNTMPIRGEPQPLRLRRTGFTYQCNECHRSFLSSPERKTLNAEHMDLVLDHGQNDYCLNCHHYTNRNSYVAHDGSEIPADQAPQLCGKCHGLVLRDWENGAHGRRNGYWQKELGEQERLICIQCHDPHSPKFPSMIPMPGPQGADWRSSEEHK